MTMMVGFTGAGTNNISEKKTNYGSKIGAGIGIATGIARTFVKRGIIKDLGGNLIISGHSPAVARSSQVLGIALGIGLLAGLGALIGKGVEKIVNIFKKDEPKGVIPGGNPKPTLKVEGDPFEKYRKAPQSVGRKVMTKDGEEYVIHDGHPKTVYKKDKETGELILQSSVYDGSWGKEMSDEDLIVTIKQNQELEKLKKEGQTTYVGSDGKESYIEN